MKKPWVPRLDRRVYVADRKRYPEGIVVALNGEIATLDTGTHEGTMPRFIDVPIADLRRTAKEIADR